MKQYEVISECIDLDGERKYPGDLLELDDEQYIRAKNAGIVGNEMADDDEIEGLKKLGNGYYELPNGEKVRGLDKAKNALQKLKEGESVAEVETGDSSDSGAGDVKSD
ncbi:hypothetical protein AB4Z17_28965 [Paenibacillus sp. TAF43_2]|uniref:hypothetical protein n=1 Tax=Paenibacillus sp. TAF43_2 TaxID=3233069 RepID=UPI003F994556